MSTTCNSPDTIVIRRVMIWEVELLLLSLTYKLKRTRPHDTFIVLSIYKQATWEMNTINYNGLWVATLTKDINFELLKCTWFDGFCWLLYIHTKVQTIYHSFVHLGWMELHLAIIKDVHTSSALQAQGCFYMKLANPVVIGKDAFQILSHPCSSETGRGGHSTPCRDSYTVSGVSTYDMLIYEGLRRYFNMLLRKFETSTRIWLCKMFTM